MRVEFLWLAGRMHGNFMDHTAHHADVKIPLYRLPEAQKALESPEMLIPGQGWRRFTAD